MAGKEASSSSEEVMPLRSVPEGFEMRRRASMRSVKSGLIEREMRMARIL